MATLDFFADSEDIVAVLEILFEKTDVQILEQSSRNDCEVREFKSVHEVASAFTLGEDRYGNGFSTRLCLWSPSVMPSLTMRRIDFDQHVGRKTHFRYEPAGGGLMQLYLGGVHERTLTKSHFGHFNRAGAPLGLGERHRLERADVALPPHSKSTSQRAGGGKGGQPASARGSAEAASPRPSTEGHPHDIMALLSQRDLIAALARLSS